MYSCTSVLGVTSWTVVPWFALMGRSWPSDSTEVGVGAVRGFATFLVPGPTATGHPWLIDFFFDGTTAYLFFFFRKGSMAYRVAPVDASSTVE